MRKSLSLRAILAAGARGRGVWVGASVCRATRAVGRVCTGGDDSKGWSVESKSSDVTSEAELEEGGEEPAPLTASPWGT